MNILKFVNDVLSTTSTEQEKDGALCIMSALAPIALESKKVVPMMEPFFVNYVFPIFKSECPFLRARVSHDKKEKRETIRTDIKYNICIGLRYYKAL